MKTLNRTERSSSLWHSVDYIFIMQTKDMNLYISSVVDKYSDMVYRIAYHALCDTHYAEDITQEVFLKLCKLAPIFESDEHEKAWLIKVTVNMCKNHNKKVYTHPNVELTDNIPVHDEYNDGTVLGAVMALPQKYRTVVYMFYYEGYQIKEISAVLDMNINTVSSLLARARKKLETMLEGEFDNGK